MNVGEIRQKISVTPHFEKQPGDLVCVAGDISATNVLLAAVAVNHGQVRRIATSRYDGQQIFDNTPRDFDSVHSHFLYEAGLRREDVDRTVFAPAGPIIDGRCKMTNAGFSLSKEAGLKINDGRSSAYTLAAFIDFGEQFRRADFPHPDGSYGEIVPGENFEIVSPGTGFGRSELLSGKFSKIFFPRDSEGGHTLLPADVRNPEEVRLHQYLYEKLGIIKMLHYEAVVSGKGLNMVFDFFRQQAGIAEQAELQGYFRKVDEAKTVNERAGIIAGTAKKFPGSCFEKTLDYEWEVVGRRAYDSVVDGKGLGGVCIGGGWIIKDLSDRVIQQVMKGYYSGPSHRNLLDKVPIFACMDKEACLNGAVQVAIRDLYWEHENQREAA